MRLLDKNLLRLFATMPCELCGRRPANGHHVIVRGAGGGGRLDHPWNLIALCAEHHTWVHDGGNCRVPTAQDLWRVIRGGNVRVPTAQDLWRVIAKREGLNGSDLEAILWVLWRLPERPTAAQVERECRELTSWQAGAVQGIVAKALREAS